MLTHDISSYASWQCLGRGSSEMHMLCGCNMFQQMGKSCHVYIYVQYTCVWERLRSIWTLRPLSPDLFSNTVILYTVCIRVYIYIYVFKYIYIIYIYIHITIIHTLGGSPRESWVVPPVTAPVVTVPILPCSRVKPSGWCFSGRQWQTPSWISWSHWSVGWIGACQPTGSHLLQGPW